MLFVLRLEVAQLPVQFVEAVLQVLDLGEGVLNFMLSARNGFFLRVQQVLATRQSLIVVFGL